MAIRIGAAGILYEMDIKEAIERELAAQPDVRLAYLFGSRATSRAAAGSDWDLGVLFDRRAAPDRGLVLADHLARLLGIRCDVVALARAPIEFLTRIVLEGERLSVSRDDPVEFEANILARASVEKPVLERQRAEIMEGGSRGRAVERYREALGAPRRLYRQARSPE